MSTPTRDPRSASLFLLTVACLAFGPATSSAQSGGRPANPEAAIDTLLQNAIDAGRLVGATVAVMRGEQVITARGYGLADIENGVPVHAETVMKIGSITKQFTSSIIMQLVEEGRLELDDPITDYVEGPVAWQDVTVRHLLNHTSGIWDYTRAEDFVRTQALDLTDEERMAPVRAAPLDFPVGTDHRYSNSGYYLLGMIITRVTGLPFREALARRLLHPLGLSHTSYCDDEPIIPRRARGYDILEEGVRNTTYMSMETPGAAGAMCSTPLDLIRWTQALHEGEVVSAPSFGEMTTPVPPAGENGRGYGYGLSIGDLQGHRSVGHGGGINGFSAAVAYYPDDDLTVAVIVNGGGPAGGIARRIAALLLGVEVPARRGR